jgi:RNA polymerase sigma-70 factor, ECF subfamily
VSRSSGDARPGVVLRWPTRTGRPEPSTDDASGRAAEADLLERSRSGDRDAFRRLVATHQDRLFALALRLSGSLHEAEDLAQESLLRAYEALPGFRGDCGFWSWLRVICRNLYRNQAAVGWRRAPNDALLDAADPAPGAGEALDAKRRRAIVEWGLGQIPPDLREVLVFRHSEHLSYEEIAALLELPVGTVRSRLHRGRARLARLLVPRLR